MLNAVVTGANRGIGLELVKQLATATAAVEAASSSSSAALRFQTIYALCRRPSEGLMALANDKKTSNNNNNNNENNKTPMSTTKIQIVPDIDVTQETSRRHLQQDEFGNPTIPIHLLVHNAGAYGPPPPHFTDENGKTHHPGDYATIEDMFQSQSLQDITEERLLYTFQ